MFIKKISWAICVATLFSSGISFAKSAKCQKIYDDQSKFYGQILDKKNKYKIAINAKNKKKQTKGDFAKKVGVLDTEFLKMDRKIFATLKEIKARAKAKKRFLRTDKCSDVEGKNYRNLGAFDKSLKGYKGLLSDVREANRN